MIILGHRGASAYAPENTFAAFDLAVNMGADGIETDVQITRDGALILLHDDTLDRTTNGHGRLIDQTGTEVDRLDAGGWYDQRFAGERLPHLELFIERYLGVLLLDLEIKAPGATDPLIALLMERNLGTHPALEITSFSWNSMLRVHELLPNLTAGCLTLDLTTELIEQVTAAGLQQICPVIGAVSPELVASAHARNIQVRTWGIRDRDDLARASASRVDGATLNWPDWKPTNPD